MSAAVSYIMPCYNAARTLPMAVASLVAQEMDDWECVVVDDGSTDGSADVVASVGDPRFNIIRFAENRGRGEARRTALAACTGKYLAILDADDWTFPQRTSRQMEILEQDPSLTAVSAGMAIIDDRDRIVARRTRGVDGAAGQQAARAVFRRLEQPPIMFPPAMFRRADIGSTSFEPAFARAQDTDFVVSVLLGRRYVALSELLYAFRGSEARPLSVYLKNLHYTRMLFRKHGRRFPLRSRLLILRGYAKEAVYRAAHLAGRGEALVWRQYRQASQEDRRAYEAALETVSSKCRELFEEPHVLA